NVAAAGFSLGDCVRKPFNTFFGTLCLMLSCCCTAAEQTCWQYGDIWEAKGARLSLHNVQLVAGYPSSRCR
ncbi:unnamed protein product, partial [Ceratitis capitata]